MIDLNGMTILLTGGTGSFGNAFIERVTTCWPDATIRMGVDYMLSLNK